MNDVGTCLKRGAARLAAAGKENPWREARLLLAHATGLSDEVLIGYPERTVGSCDEFAALIDRRAAHEPISHILGRREFWSLDFEVTADTLDPRPDSETIVEAALDCFQNKSQKLRILDLGTGTGCLLAALLVEFTASCGLGVERCPATARVANGNIAKLKLTDRATILVADWTAPLDGKFDLVVSNPPYIPTIEIARLQPEVARYDPSMALDGGHDGLDAYRRLMAGLPQILANDGIAIFEFGADQQGAIVQLAVENGLVVRDSRADLAGRPRCLICGLETASNP
jgi:release factor glutamine methyltransferase